MAGVKPTGQKQQPRLIGKERDAIRDLKKKLGELLTKKAFKHLDAIVDAGPGDYSEECSEQRQLFQWAVTFAADRGGLPRQSGVQIDGAAEGIPPITVQIVGHVRPAE